ncbi:hypothetical protein O181_105272 [Austropuccinia psidii MF-1]|uniref:Uncharacterized protein n=1 Tax=Austropuccinia psidii MF-1 TaxID=1389203 RepID=A0A9Q3JN81_9BASI|nr:hypothetical protein [Austropuccinia psidii MF-1]
MSRAEAAPHPAPSISLHSTAERQDHLEFSSTKYRIYRALEIRRSQSKCSTTSLTSDHRMVHQKLPRARLYQGIYYTIFGASMLYSTFGLYKLIKGKQ